METALPRPNLPRMSEKPDRPVVLVTEGSDPRPLEWLKQRASVVEISHEDPALTGIDPVPNAARPARLRIVQNNGFAFGGNNAVTLFGEVA